MYAIGMLGSLMILESLGQEYPFWLAPLNTLLLLGFFGYLSYRNRLAPPQAIKVSVK